MLDDLEEILQSRGIKDYDDMSSAEKETYFQMLDMVEKAEITLEGLKRYITSLKQAVEAALVDEPEFNYIFIFKVPNRKQIMMKARLKNYLIFEAFFSAPDRAKQMLEQYKKVRKVGDVR